MAAARKPNPELFRATRPFAREDRAKTWRLLAGSVAVFAAGIVVAAMSLPLPVRILGSVIAGMTTVRLFIFYHDYLHGALFRNSGLGRACMTVVGLYTLSPPSVWKETHDYHHQNNARMVGASIGSFPVMTLRMWGDADPTTRRLYKVLRHPLTMITGYFTVFMLGMCFSSFRRSPREHWVGPVAVVLHWAIFLTLGFTVDWTTAILCFWFPSALATGLGSYLFYAQHNFPGVKLYDRRQWTFDKAAFESSSMFDMSPLMHWFTGNIGFHHIHHFNHTIPFYNLPAAMDALPELQKVGHTSWKWSDVKTCLSLKLWDPEQGKMVGFPAE